MINDIHNCIYCYEERWSEKVVNLDNSVGLQVIHHHWKSLLFLYDVQLHGGHTKFLSHFNQYSLIDPSRGNIPSWVFGRGLAIDSESYGFAFHTTVVLETEFYENNNIFIFHPEKHKFNWKIVSAINVTYAPIQIYWARNIASNYSSQQQPASSFTTVSNVMVLLCELRHQ